MSVIRKTQKQSSEQILPQFKLIVMRYLCLIGMCFSVLSLLFTIHGILAIAGIILSVIGIILCWICKFDSVHFGVIGVIVGLYSLVAWVILPALNI